MGAPAVAKKPGEVIASEQDVTAGPLKVNDAYDLELIRLSDGNYSLKLFMKVQFFFEAEEPDRWTMTEKLQFISDWESCVRSVWDNLSLRSLSGKKVVNLSLQFETQIGGFMLDHWEVTVRKSTKATFRSYVQPGLGNVVLTHSDNKPVTRSVSISKGASTTHKYAQPTSAHEFGHMLGLDDEYGPLFGGDPGPHDADYDSVMNIGSQVRNRHKNFIKGWLDKALAENGIK